MLIRCLLYVVACLLVVASNEVRNELMDAVHRADYEHVKLLLGLDPTVLSSRPPVMVDRVDEQFGRTALLVCGLDPSGKDVTALDQECVKIAKALHRKGANMSHMDKNGWDAVSIGASRGLTRFCRYLVSQHKVDPNRIDAKGRTSLMKAAAHGHYETFAMLLNYSANPLLVEPDSGMSAVHLATVHALHNPDQMQFLRNVTLVIVEGNTTKSGVFHGGVQLPIDTFRDKDGRTPLMYAAISNNAAVSEVLLAAGADPRLADNYGVACSAMPASADLRARLIEAGIALTEKEHKRWLKASKKAHQADL